MKQDIESLSNIKCSVIYNVIHTDLISTRKSRKLKNHFNIIQVKRLTHERKGQDLLIEAANILIQQKGYHHFKIYLVGGGESYTLLK